MNSSRPRKGLLLGLCILLPVFCSCGGMREQGPTDGETHFLKACRPETDDCGSGLSCVCGVCSRPCSDNAACRKLTGAAQCVADVDRPAGAVCSEPSTPAVCDLSCWNDADCAGMRFASRCANGFCRASSDITAGDAGDAGGAGGAGAAGAAGGGAGGAGTEGQAGACARGEVTGSEVLVLGDVFVAQSGITANLEQLAREAGALGAGANYRNKSTIANNGLGTGVVRIAGQYAAGKSEGPVKVVIATGGGADALLRSCDPSPTPECQLIVDAVAGADGLLTQMAQDGIENVIWFFYPDPADAEMLAEFDVLRPLLQQSCENSAVSCHWLELEPTFAGHYGEYLQTDAIPTAAGAQAAAGAIWDVMKANCIAQ